MRLRSLVGRRQQPAGVMGDLFFWLSLATKSTQLEVFTCQRPSLAERMWGRTGRRDLVRTRKRKCTAPASLLPLCNPLGQDGIEQGQLINPVPSAWLCIAFHRATSSHLSLYYG